METNIGDLYLLYEGMSVDGRGEPKYIGKTLDREKALLHLKACLDNPYNTGKVELVTDTAIRQLMRYDLQKA